MGDFPKSTQIRVGSLLYLELFYRLANTRESATGKPSQTNPKAAGFFLTGTSTPFAGSFVKTPALLKP